MSTKIKYISERCSYKKDGNVLTIVIISYKTNIGNALFFAWMICMAFVGSYTLYAYFNEILEAKQKVFMLVFLAFWTYFILKIGRAFLWRIYGKELILVDDDGVSIKNDIRSFGKSVYTDLEMVNGINEVTGSELSFFEGMTSNYWNIAGEKLVLNKDGKDLYFAKELPSKEIQALKKLLSQHLKKVKN